MEKRKTGRIILSAILCIVLLAGTFGSGFFTGAYLYKGGKEAVSVKGGSQQSAAESPEGTQDNKDTDQAGEDTYVEGSYVTSKHLAEQTMEKYKNETSPYGYSYGPAITGLSRSDVIEIELGFDVETLGFEYWTEIMDLFEDPQLMHSVGNNWDYDKETGIVTLSPTNHPSGMIMVNSLDTVTAGKYEHDDLMLFPHDAGTDWGNQGTLYLATYVDLNTGEKLSEPVVQVVSLKGELPDTPRLQYSYTEDGRVHFNWTEVEGAEEYFVCSMSYYEDSGLSTFLSVIGSTTGTEWVSEAPEYGSVTANQGFSNYNVAMDDWYNEYYMGDRTAEYGETPLNVYKTENRELYYVIAVSQAGTSMMSNPIDILDIQENIPVSLASDTWDANGYQYGCYESPEDTASYGYVTMADGATAMKLLDYHTEKAVVVEDRYIYTDEEGNYLEGKNVTVLKIPYRIEGTPFEDVVLLKDYDESRLEEDLKYIEEREELLRKRAGDVALDNNIEFEEGENVTEEVREVDIEITANSALSEYLAKNMLSGVSVIDVSEFDEAADASMLADALLEAYYQNPLILGISGYRMNRTGTAVKIAYEETPADMASKQEELKIKIAEIVSEIITEDMTELEKELAINQYLCDTCTYDDAALENAEQNDFACVDSEFKDSFTAYGALINGRCVCAGYAAAFKLLADASGLESVVVTGTLEGTLPHAWNKVRIDGEWEILDTTNNDNEFLSNALLNLPDEAGNRTLTEDSDYVLDGYMRNYVATNGQREYYRLNGLYYSYDQIGEKLAEQLNENGTALLRTEYALDDETFDKIGQEVYDAMAGDEPLYGYYWMGVIYLTKEK